MYSLPLAAQGYDVYLADLSETLVQKAQAKDAAGLLKGCDVTATRPEIVEICGHAMYIGRKK